MDCVKANDENEREVPHDVSSEEKFKTFKRRVGEEWAVQSYGDSVPFFLPLVMLALVCVFPSGGHLSAHTHSLSLCDTHLQIDTVVTLYLLILSRCAGCPKDVTMPTTERRSACLSSSRE